MDRKIKTLLVVISVIIFLIIEGLIGASVNPLFKQEKILVSSKYDVVYRFNNDVDLDNSFYDLSRILRFTNGVVGKAEILMQKNVSYTDMTPFEVPALKSNEVIVSENFLIDNELAIGDSIRLNNPIYDGIFEFVIVDSISGVYGYFEKNVDTSMGVIIVGNDQVLIDNNSLNSVVFCSEDYSIGQSGVSLLETTNKNAVLEEIHIERNRQLAYLACLMILIEILLFVAYYLFGSSRLKKKVIEGSSRFFVRRYIFIEFAFPVTLSTLLSCLFYEVYLLITVVNIEVWPVIIAMVLVAIALALSSVYRLLVRRI